MKKHLLSAALLLSLCSTAAFAIPQKINYQGYLAATDGTPLDTTVSVIFTIYDAVSGGTALWSETHPAVTVEQGLFAVSLGFIQPIEDVFSAMRWLGVAVGTDTEMSPRQQIVSVAHAYRVGTVDGATGGSISGKLNVGSGNTNAGNWANVFGQNSAASGDYSAVAGGGGNTASGPGAFIGGGNANNASGIQATVSGGNSNTASQLSSVVGGGENNLASAGAAAIAGGSSNTASGIASTVSGGSGNIASASLSTIAGGSSNRARGNYSVVAGGGGELADSNSAQGVASTVGGGRRHLVLSSYGTVAGGFHNSSLGNSSTVSGGANNYARGDYTVVAGGGGFLADSNSAQGHASTIGGGRRNLTFLQDATIAGGYQNSASGVASVIGGGAYNSAEALYSTAGGGYGNTANHEGATVGGGSGNDALGLASTVGGGRMNRSLGWDATIPGGRSNSAYAAECFAAGAYAKALYVGSFVWGSSSTDDSTTSFNSHTVTFRCQNGARFYTHASATNVGVNLPAGGGAWANLCDENQKRLHDIVNTGEILEKLSALPLHRWSYKTQDESIQHIGPTAQDFRAAFGLGDNNTTISTLDPDGVALAAIQQLAKENNELKARLARVESLLQAQSAGDQKVMQAE